MFKPIIVIALVVALFASLSAFIFAGAQTSQEHASDWLTANRDYVSTHYSPLDQITTANVSKLRPHCSYDLGERVQFQDAPLAIDGVLYVATFENTYAINGSTCHLLWRVHRPLPAIPGFGSIRGLGYSAARVYVATLDGHVMALAASSGQKIWDKQVLPSDGPAYFDSAPLVADGMVYVGNGGSDVGAIGKMFALDARDGHLVWTRSLVATGNEPGADTWPKKPGVHIAGGGTWTSYTFDPQRHVLYVPVGNPGPDFDGDYRPGANLYTNSLVILNGSDGALQAYLQLVPHDVHDWDVSTPPVLITTRAGTPIAAAVGKDGYLYETDPQLKSVIHKTVTTTMYNGEAPITRAGTRFCPGTQGGTEFNPAAYSRQTNLLYINSVDWCSTIKLAAKTEYVPGKPFVGSSNGFGTLDPQDRARGWLNAVDADTGYVRWRWQSPTPLLAAVVATGGGIVFTGDLRGDFMAFNATSGKLLYHHRLASAIPGGLAAYAASGKEYVVVVSGYPGPIWHLPKTTDKIVIFGL